ncbi:phenylacetate-coenzyme A ligase [Methanocella paludicola SANAE]|uniref:Phenylacetate-coenzyme A ligase n=1 Tax=Methanocella paludicola (strain DSM 17711 / JCM 13418 / NBRC 101707 / SANAE) TaxID=304371 RepID=D1YXU3_METPS|nr:phenylacetate--CoA ligase [Methanocella paludicola]BAI61265.1 phenylacetate-coenzyme A ligase [Methanocella paludicola SANAE]
MEYWQPRFETMKRKQLEELQLKRLKKSANSVYKNVPFYKKKFDEAGVRPSDIKSVDDVRKLPFTKKTDLRDNYPFGLFAVPRSKINRLHASSGTSGKSTVVGYTKNDLKVWAELMARCFYMAGVRPGDVFQNAANYGLFTGGLGIHAGAERLGCAVVPSGTGSTQKQIEMIRDFGVTAFHATPSYALYIAETAKKLGIEPGSLPIKIGLFGAEPWSVNTRKELEKSFGIKAYDSYGLSEMMGPGVGFECKEQDGLHIWEDAFILEVLDKRGEPCDPEEKGELTLTTLCKEAMPLIRYRTGDITKLMDGECECGRTARKITKFFGRADDMLIIRGLNVFPSQIEHVLMDMPEVGEYFQVVLERVNHMDEMTVKVEMSDRAFSGELGDLKKVTGTVTKKLKEQLNLRTNVMLVEKGSLPRFEGKSKKVIDMRTSI